MDNITRQTYWNADGFPKIIMFVLLVPTMLIFLYGLYRRWQMWKLGQEHWRKDNTGQRISKTFKDVFLHSKLLKDFFPGVMHFAIFWGFVFLFMGTALETMHYYLGIPVHEGKLYLYFSLLYDVAGIAAIIGICMASFRRCALRPSRLETTKSDVLSLLLILFILVSGFIIEGLRIAAQTAYPAQMTYFSANVQATNFEFESWSIVGWFLASFMKTLTMESLQFGHKVWWILHMIGAFVFIAYIPYSKLLHIITAPANIFEQNQDSPGKLTKLDLEDEEAETFGVTNIKEYNSKQLLDLDACTECGRCQDACPAHLSEKPLSPKKLVLSLRNDLRETCQKLACAKKSGEENAEIEELGKIIEDYVSKDEIWSCTTCGACQEKCPVYIEHIQKVVDLRRNLVLMESDFPQEVTTTFKNMEVNGSPWKVGREARMEWTKDLDVPLASETEGYEYLYWVGCAGSIDDRNRKVSQAMVKLLKAAGVKFAILGSDENCCGETARRLGNEYLFQMMAAENIETLKEMSVKKVIVQCPHCFNTFKNEYPEFGAEFEVVHHTQLLKELVSQNKLKLKKSVDVVSSYHDSCYLGRHNEIYSEPRALLSQVSSKPITEVDRCHESGFCCGAGGGRMWMEEHLGKRINNMRVQEFVDKAVKQIVTACPYCLTMMEDGLGVIDDQKEISAKDLAEILADSIE